MIHYDGMGYDLFSLSKIRRAVSSDAEQTNTGISDPQSKITDLKSCFY